MNEKIMIVDNEPDVVELLGLTLNSMPCEKISFTNPVEALKALATEHVFIALVDFKMPHLNGLEFCTEAKKINHSLKFIIISGFVDADMVDDGKRIGIVDYFNKPIDNKKLLMKIQTVMKEREDEIAADQEIKKMFVEEISETFSAIEDKILKLEDNVDAGSVTESLFRAFHNLKGGSASAGFLKLSRFAHGVENRLNKLREGTETISKPLIDYLLKSNDIIRNTIEMLKNDINSDIDIQENTEKIDDKVAKESVVSVAEVKLLQPDKNSIAIEDDLIIRNLSKIISTLKFENGKSYNVLIKSNKIDAAGMQFVVALKKTKDFSIDMKFENNDIVKELEKIGIEVHLL